MLFGAVVMNASLKAVRERERSRERGSVHCKGIISETYVRM